MKSYLLLSCMILGSMALPAPPAGQPAQPALFDPSRVTVKKAMNFATVNDMIAWKNYLFKHPVCDGDRTNVKQDITRADCAKANQKTMTVGFRYYVQEYHEANLSGRLQDGRAPCLSQLSKAAGHKDMPEKAKGLCYTVNILCESHLTRSRPSNSESDRIKKSEPPATAEQLVRPFRDYYKLHPNCRPQGKPFSKLQCIDRNKGVMVATGFTYQGRCRSPYERDIQLGAMGACHQRTARDVLRNPPRTEAEQNQGANENPGPRHRASANAALSNLLN